MMNNERIPYRRIILSMVDEIVDSYNIHGWQPLHGAWMNLDTTCCCPMSSMALAADVPADDIQDAVNGGILEMIGSRLGFTSMDVDHFVDGFDNPSEYEHSYSEACRTGVAVRRKLEAEGRVISRFEAQQWKP